MIPGNRTSSSTNGVVQTYSYFRNGTNTNNGQRLQSEGSRTFAYDANGNTASVTGPSGGVSFLWDYDNQLVGMSGSVSAGYKYDYDGAGPRGPSVAAYPPIYTLISAR